MLYGLQGQGGQGPVPHMGGGGGGAVKDSTPSRWGSYGMTRLHFLAGVVHCSRWGSVGEGRQGRSARQGSGAGSCRLEAGGRWHEWGGVGTAD